jgi:hypothetical protein
VLKSAAVIGAASLTTAACNPFATEKAATGPASVRRFHSRPDLVVPTIKVLQGTEETPTGYIFGNVHAPKLTSGPLIVDGRGELVWFQPVPGKYVADLNVQTYEGRPVLTWWQGDIISGHGQGTCVIADFSYRQLAAVQAHNGLMADLHDFQLTAGGTALITAYATADADLSGIGGPRKGRVLNGVIQEIDLASGELVFEWRSLDHVAITETHSKWTKSSTAQGPFDYFHINSIDVDADGNLLISARNTWALYKIDRQSGAVIWRLGGRKSDFAMGKGTNFEWQHDARHHPDGVITVFDDAAAPQEEPRSRGLKLTVDEQSMVVSLADQYTNGSVLTSSQGNVQVLPDSNVFVGWGAEPRYTGFTSAGRIIYDARFLIANQSYRTFNLPWTGLPSEAPTAVVEQGSHSGVIVYASWNGATEVASWQVLGGSDAQHLALLGAAARSGFETAIGIADVKPYIVARAFDSAGAILGSSGPAPTTT